MKPVQYRNRKPLEYLPHDFRTALKSGRYYSRVFFVRRKKKKLPGKFVGAGGIVLLALGEFIQGQFGIVLFLIGTVLVATGIHFELLNRIVYQFKYFVVPGITAVILAACLIWPATFGLLLPARHESLLSVPIPGFPLDSDEVTFKFGGGDRFTATYTRKELEQAGSDSLWSSRNQIPFVAHLDGGRLYLDADIYAGADLPPIRIRRNVVQGLPEQWDGNYNGRAIEIVSPDTMPLFQFFFETGNRIRVNGVFGAPGKLIIADESGVSTYQGKRVLFYGTKPIFEYPSWRYPHRRADSL